MEGKGSEDEGLKDLHFAQSGQNNKILKRLKFHTFENDNLAKYPVVYIYIYIYIYMVEASCDLRCRAHTGREHVG